MHAVIWTSAGQRFALPTSSIVEVVPVVQTTPLPHGPAEVKGVFNYRGTLIPLLDAAALLRHAAVELRMAARILVVRTGQVKDDSSRAPQMIGLLVQQVLGSENLDAAEPSQSARPTASGPGFLGPVVLTPAGTVQLIEPQGFATVDIQPAVSYTQARGTQEAP
ncbi:MAG: chemotaxis protein CheW [Planctomycetota bacterium]|nr:chemotaxis protein CheW [Planctomycetota bacterium]